MLELSQTDVARAIATSVQQIRTYEDGSQQISTDHIDRLAAVLKVPARFFLDPVDRGTTANDLAALPFPDEVMDFLTSPDGLLLMAAFMRIKDRHIQRCIVHFIAQVARLGDESELSWLN
jgi:transcriptional regulator with XRE-family HTH domain